MRGRGRYDLGVGNMSVYSFLLAYRGVLDGSLGGGLVGACGRYPLSAWRGVGIPGILVA